MNIIIVTDMKKIPAVNVILKFTVGNVVISVTGVHVRIVWIPLHHRLLSSRQANHDRGLWRSVWILLGNAICIFPRLYDLSPPTFRFHTVFR